MVTVFSNKKLPDALLSLADGKVVFTLESTFYGGKQKEREKVLTSDTSLMHAALTHKLQEAASL
jgi:hypothetical protein